MVAERETATGCSVTHYADEAPGYPPICGEGQEGDRMSFFPNDVTCIDCLGHFGRSEQ